jgi:predicted transcriptional regulator
MNRVEVRQDKCVNIYWTPEFVKELDELSEALSLRRNEFIKQAVLEKMEREEALRRRLSKTSKKS